MTLSSAIFMWRRGQEQEGSMGVAKGQIGQFFLVIGAIALVVFFTTGNGGNPPVLFFLVGAVLIVLGVLLIRKDWKPGPDSGRFRLLKGTKRKKETKEEAK